MPVHVRVPGDMYVRQRPVRAAERFYKLLDSGALRVQQGEYAGSVALNTVAQEFGVSAQTVWSWIREYTEVNALVFV